MLEENIEYRPVSSIFFFKAVLFSDKIQKFPKKLKDEAVLPSAMHKLC